MLVYQRVPGDIPNFDIFNGVVFFLVMKSYFMSISKKLA